MLLQQTRMPTETHAQTGDRRRSASQVPGDLTMSGTCDQQTGNRMQ
jgi:hypothetical protein